MPTPTKNSPGDMNFISTTKPAITSAVTYASNTRTSLFGALDDDSAPTDPIDLPEVHVAPGQSLIEVYGTLWSIPHQQLEDQENNNNYIIEVVSQTSDVNIDINPTQTAGQLHPFHPCCQVKGLLLAPRQSSLQVKGPLLCPH